jgi:ubiquinol-cytochrome c reductase cytochrome c subunit
MRLLAVLLLLLAAPQLAAAGAPPGGIVHPKVTPRTPLKELGYQLYAGNCLTCHGPRGEGAAPSAPIHGGGDLTGSGPSLRGVGAQAPDFYLRTGYMPLSRVREQPYRSRVLFTEREIDALVAYVASLAPGPPIPKPHPERGDLSRGMRLFTQHCSGCHQIVAEGGLVTGARVPPLKEATPVQIAEAVRIGPYLMPRFSTRAISSSDLDSIIAYVDWAKHPDDRGGWGIGHIGPIPEGMVTWLIAVVLLVALCAVIGERRRHE